MDDVTEVMAKEGAARRQFRRSRENLPRMLAREIRDKSYGSA
jgi:hypothetical protein